MRLVDADKQLEWVDCMTQMHGIGLEPVVAVETVRDLIKGAPTIYAIPVEWLIDRANDPERAPLYRRYAQMLYEEWWKEQEA